MRNLIQKRLPLTVDLSPKRSKWLPVRILQNRRLDALPEQRHVVEAVTTQIPAQMLMRSMLSCKILSALDARIVLE
jgi:hypothetical protein